MSFLEIWDNDESIYFFIENGYPSNYNDGLLAFLRDVYATQNSTLNDLYKRYKSEFGDKFNMAVYKSAVKLSLVEPAATFTSATPTNGGGGTIVLTSAGAHGLTAASAVGASIYISAGTNWTAGFYPVTALDLDTTGVAITITGTFVSGMGSPTIALANTEVTLATITIPPLLANSLIEIDTSFSSNSTSGNTKSLRVRHNGQAYLSAALSTTPNSHTLTIIQNRNSTSSQVGSFTTSSAVGYGNSGTVQPTQSINTAVETSVTLTVQPAVANEVLSIERYFVRVTL